MCVLCGIEAAAAAAGTVTVLRNHPRAQKIWTKLMGIIRKKPKAPVHNQSNLCR